MSTKRELLLAAIEAAGTIWDCPTAEKGSVQLVILSADLAKSLVDGARLALAMLDRMADVDLEAVLGEKKL